jgi:hypothetical protein
MSGSSEYYPPWYHSRRQELQPVLTELTKQAILAYDALKPNAEHGEVAEPVIPGVQLEVFELAGRVVGSMVRVHFDEHHRLSVYHNHTPTNLISYDWQFVRTQVPDSQHAKTVTKVTKFPPWLEDLDGVFELAVNQGQGESENLCGPENDYRDAESHITDFQADIDLAVRVFGI